MSEDAEKNENSEEHSSILFFTSIPSRSMGCAKELSGD